MLIQVNNHQLSVEFLSILRHWTSPVDVAMETTLVERDFLGPIVFIIFHQHCLFQTFDSPTPPLRSPIQKDLKGKPFPVTLLYLSLLKREMFKKASNVNMLTTYGTAGSCACWMFFSKSIQFSFV